MTKKEFIYIVDQINAAYNSGDVGTYREEGFSIRVTLSNGHVIEDAVWSYDCTGSSTGEQIIQFHPSDKETVYVAARDIITVEMEP